jgi:type IV secretory pathway VirB10-like protein
MPFSTTSYLAGVGTVVAALTVGFSGGLFLAVPERHVEQNRLQRVSSTAPISDPAPQTAVTRKLETVPANAASPPAPAIQQPARPVTIPVMAKTVEPELPSMTARAPESAREAAEQDRTARAHANAEKMRAAEARAAERRRAKAQQSTERRKQREEVATVAGKRMLRDRDPQQLAVRTETPFGFFGED